MLFQPFDHTRTALTNGDRDCETDHNVIKSCSVFFVSKGDVNVLWWHGGTLCPSFISLVPLIR